MAAFHHSLLNAARWALIVALCLFTSPGQPARAQEEPLPACSPAVVENEVSALVAAVDPILPIEIYFATSDYDYAARVQGRVAPNTTLVIASGGWTGSTTSNMEGVYSFSLGLKDCVSGLDRDIRDGDTVQVTAGDQTYTTVAHDLSASMDPLTNTVNGRADPGLLVHVSLTETQRYASCENPPQIMLNASAIVDEMGKFAAPMDNFTGLAEAVLHINHGDGRSFTSTYVQNVFLNLDTNYFSSGATVGAAITYTLSRDGEVIESTSLLYELNISHSFAEPLQPGDVIEARTGELLLYHAVVSPLNGVIDVENNQIRGQTSPGTPVNVTYRPDFPGEGAPVTYCGEPPGSSGQIKSCVQAGEDGTFRYDPPVKIQPGYQATFTQYDQQGNVQSRSLGSGSIISVNYQRDTVFSYFDHDRKPMLQLFSADGELLFQSSRPTRSSGHSHYWEDLPDLEPGQVIEVGNDQYTDSMTIPAIIVNPIYGQQQVTGSAPDGEIIVIQRDFNPDQGDVRCAEGITTGGTFVVPVGSRPYIGSGQVEVIYHDGQGKYTIFEHRNREIKVSVNPVSQVSVWTLDGFVEYYEKNLSITHLRADEIVATYAQVTRDNGNFILNHLLQAPVLTGDRLLFEIEGQQPIWMNIPELEGHIDVEGQQLVGRATGARSAYAHVSRLYGPGYGVSAMFRVFPDAEGNFSALPTLRERIDLGCVPNPRNFPIDACLQVSMTSYTSEGNRIYWSGPAPQPVSADAFEPDDTPETARPYAGAAQAHTLLASGEADWVQFEVSDLEVGRPFTIAVSEMGFIMPLNYEISHADGITDRVTGTFLEGGSQQVQVTPTQAGTYTLKLQAASSGWTYGVCDSRYLLTIERPVVWVKAFLPLVLNSGR